MDTAKILNELRSERNRIDRAIVALEALAHTGRKRVIVPRSRLAELRGHRRRSVAARKRLSEAAKKRWAERKVTTALILKAAAPQPRGRRHVSAASRRKMAESQRKRWAAQKKAAAKTA